MDPEPKSLLFGYNWGNMRNGLFYHVLNRSDIVSVLADELTDGEEKAVSMGGTVVRGYGCFFREILVPKKGFLKDFLGKLMNFDSPSCPGE